MAKNAVYYFYGFNLYIIILHPSRGFQLKVAKSPKERCGQVYQVRSTYDYSDAPHVAPSTVISFLRTNFLRSEEQSNRVPSQPPAANPLCQD